MYNTLQHEPLVLRNIFHIQVENVLPSLSKDLLNQLNDLIRRIMRMIADVYEEGVRKGKFRKGHGMAHADIIWSLFTGLVIWEESKRNINPKKDFLKPTLDKAFEIFCLGIMKRNERKANDNGRPG